MKLKRGDFAPHFVSKSTNEVFFDSKSVIGKKSVVLYFYPKDFTMGCTAQACSFRDEYEDFTSLNAEIIGVSNDSDKRHEQFKTKYKLPFLLLADKNNELKTLYGIQNTFFGLLPKRVTFVIDATGKIIEIIDSLLVNDHIKKAALALKKK